MKVLVPEPVPHQVYRDDQIERVKRLKNITVALMGESNEHQVISCSAMWVGKGLLLTAGHCVEKNKIFSYETIDEKDNILHLAIVKTKDDNNDLALLIVDPKIGRAHV